MKRLVLTVTGTVAGLASLLSFKSQAHPIATAGPLPSLGTSGTSATTGTTGTSGSGSSHRTATKHATHRTAARSSAAPASKTVTGQAIQTPYGVVQVKATVTGGRITDVAFVQLTAYDQHSQQINSYAGPVLLRESMTKQSAQVDTVSGASYTSEGYRESLQSALDKAGVT